MMFLNSKKIFQSMGSEYSLRRDWKLPGINFVKYLVNSFPSHLKRAFLVFLEYSLRIISGA
jgi:hypothetical protein